MKTRKTILLTGFEPFPGVEENPSQLVVESFSGTELPGVNLVSAILPVTYEGGEERIRGLIRQHRPDIALLTGVAGKTDPIRLERVALNLDDTDTPDNSGLVRKGRLILPDGPPAFFSNHPLIELEAALVGAGIPVKISNHAGAYLCNHVFYTARHEVDTLGLATKVGFMHVPMHREKSEESQLSLADIRLAIERSLVCLSASC